METRREIPVLILTHAGQSVWVPKPETYEALQRVAVEEFELGSSDDIQFEASLGGPHARISKSAYAPMRPFVDNITIKLLPANAQTIRGPLPTPSASSSSSTSRSRDLDDIAGMEDEEKEVAGELDRTTASGLASGSSRSNLNSRVGNSRRMAVLDDEDEDASDDLVNDSEVAEPGWDDRTERYQEEEIDEDQGREEVDLFEDAQDEDREDEEDEEGDEDEDEARDDSEELDDVRTPPRAIARLPVDRTAEPVQPRAQEEHAPKGITVKKETITELKKEIITSYNATQGQGPLETPRNKTDQASYYLITISHPATDQKVPVRTRGGHLVGKVLAGVCKPLRIPYDRARLYLVLKIYDDTGAVESQERFECHKNDTMDRAGVTEGAELLILLDGA